MSSNQTEGNTEEARVVMVDKVIHVSEVTSEKIDSLITSSQDPGDSLQNLTGKTIDQSNSKTRQENKEEICKGNNERVSEYC